MTPTVPREWVGETVAILASGPSMTPEDANYVRGKARVIVINRTIELAPWADVFYAADAKVYGWYSKKDPSGVRKHPISEFQGVKYSLTSSAKTYGAVVLRRGTTEGLSLNPAVLCGGQNSGYQAIGLAFLYGASRIILLGYDMQRGLKDEEHWHPDHPNSSRSPYQRFASYFPTLVEPLKAAGVQVINCTRRTALTCFHRMELREALPDKAVAA